MIFATSFPNPVVVKSILDEFQMKDGKYDSAYALRVAEGALKFRQKKLTEARNKISTCANKSK